MDRREQLFWKRVDKYNGENACWLWMNVLNKHGYGHCTYKGFRTYAHRISWMLHNKQQIPDKMVIMHTCDNPACVNPKHLQLGTQADNMRDMFAKQRHKRTKGMRFRAPGGEDHCRCKLTWNQVNEIRRKYDSGNFTQQYLAHEYEVAQSRISYLVRKIHRVDR